MGYIITCTANGGLKIRSQDGSLLRIFPENIQIVSIDSGTSLLISTPDQNILTLKVELNNIESIEGDIPALTAEGVIDQIEIALASVKQNVSLGSESVAITGPVTIPGSVEINNDSGNPIPTVPRSKVPINNSGLSAANTDLLSGGVGNVSGWFRASDFHSGSFQIITTPGITAGSFAFEHTNDINNAPAGGIMPMYESNQNDTPILTAINAVAGSTKMYAGPLTAEWIRIRIVNAIVGGSIGVAAELSTTPYINVNPKVTQGTPANLQSLITVAPLSAKVDVPSAVISANNTTAGFVVDGGQSQEIIVVVTAVSGTNPSLQIDVQESKDGGSNYNPTPIYTFQIPNAIGVYPSGRLPVNGNRYRYVQTIGGTASPAFTRTIIRNQFNEPANNRLDAFVQGTLNAATQDARFSIPVNGKGVLGLVVSGVTATNATIIIEASDNNGLTWETINGVLPGNINNGLGVLFNTFAIDRQFRVSCGGRTHISLRVLRPGTAAGTISITANASVANTLTALATQLPQGRNNIGRVGISDQLSFSDRANKNVLNRSRVRLIASHVLPANFLSNAYYYSNGFFDVSEYKELLVEVCLKNITLGSGLTGVTGMKAIAYGHSSTFAFGTDILYPIPTRFDFTANPINIANPTTSDSVVASFTVPCIGDQMAIGLTMNSGQFSGTNATAIVNIKAKS